MDISGPFSMGAGRLSRLKIGYLEISAEGDKKASERLKFSLEMCV